MSHQVTLIKPPLPPRVVNLPYLGYTIHDQPREVIVDGQPRYDRDVYVVTGVTESGDCVAEYQHTERI